MISTEHLASESKNSWNNFPKISLGLLLNWTKVSSVPAFFLIDKLFMICNHFDLRRESFNRQLVYHKKQQQAFLKQSFQQKLSS